MANLCFAIVLFFLQPTNADTKAPALIFNLTAVTSLPPDTLIMGASLYNNFYDKGFPSIMVSGDRGKTWRRHHFKGEIGNFFTFATFGDRYAWFLLETGYEGNDFITGMVCTKDGGKTWQFVDIGEISADQVVLFHFFTPTEGMLITYTSEKSPHGQPSVAVAKTNNGGATWQTENASTESAQWALEREVIDTVSLPVQPTYLYAAPESYGERLHFRPNLGLELNSNEQQTGLKIKFVRDGRNDGFIT